MCLIATMRRKIPSHGKSMLPWQIALALVAPTVAFALQIIHDLFLWIVYDIVWLFLGTTMCFSGQKYRRPSMPPLTWLFYASWSLPWISTPRKIRSLLFLVAHHWISYAYLRAECHGIITLLLARSLAGAGLVNRVAAWLIEQQCTILRDTWKNINISYWLFSTIKWSFTLKAQ